MTMVALVKMIPVLGPTPAYPLVFMRPSTLRRGRCLAAVKQMLDYERVFGKSLYHILRSTEENPSNAISEATDDCTSNVR